MVPDQNRKKSWRYGGFLIGVPPLHHPVVRNDNDFVLKPMMTWGSSTFGTPISQFYSQIPWFPFNRGQRHGVPGLVRRQDRFQVTAAYRASKRHSNKHLHIYIYISDANNAIINQPHVHGLYFIPPISGKIGDGCIDAENPPNVDDVPREIMGGPH